ncbi:MAG: amidase family protein, partial [Alsobacter sp.]
MIGLLDLRRRIDAGDLRPQDALAAARERIATGDAELASFVALAPPPAGPIDPARPLAGIAVGVKDIIDTCDLPTEMGLAAVWGGWQPRSDASIVSQVRAAGGWVAGKTATTALAYLDPTPTRNPHDAARTPGGSSSGSAAAVAAGLVPLAIGTQTGGSVIRPAAFCGVAAVKPSFRLLPTVGVKVQAWTLDTLGLFGAGVDDVAHALEAICGRSMRLGETPGTLRFGVVVPELGGAPEPDMAAAVDRAARALERHGMAVSTVTLPEDIVAGWHASPVVQGYEARVALAWELAHHRDRLPPGIGGALDAAASITAADDDAARGRARRARGALR